MPRGLTTNRSAKSLIKEGEPCQRGMHRNRRGARSPPDSTSATGSAPLTVPGLAARMAMQHKPPFDRVRRTFDTLDGMGEPVHEDDQAVELGLRSRHKSGARAGEASASLVSRNGSPLAKHQCLPADHSAPVVSQ